MVTMILRMYRIILIPVLCTNVLAATNSIICTNKEINADTSIGLKSLQTLHCVNSSLTNIKAGAFYKTPDLKNIVLEGNALENIPTGLFSGLKVLENIKISFNQIPIKLDNMTFAHLPSLKKLELFKCKIQWLPEDMFTNTTKIRNIILSYNNIEIIPENLFKGLNDLKKLDLSHNDIAELSQHTFTPLKHIKYLKLEWNKLEELPRGLFDSPNLKYLNLDHNRLTDVSNKVFPVGARKLEALSMASNLLNSNSIDVIYKYREGSIDIRSVGHPRSPFYVYKNDKIYYPSNAYSPLLNLRGLKKLILRNNSLSNLYADWIYKFDKLELLDLSMNNFTHLGTDLLCFASKQIVVDLRHNHIKEININSGIIEDNENENGYKNVILLDDNPLKCDCSLYQLLIRNGKVATYLSESGLKFDLENLTCSSPLELKGKLLKQLPSSVGTCDLPQQVCPNYCTVCKHHPSTNMIEYNCDSFPNSSYITTNIKNEISLKLNKPPTAINSSLKIIELDLSGLNMKKILFKPTPYLKLLNLTNSAILKPPVEFLKQNNVSLYLSNTGIECICPYVDDLKLMKNSKMIVDYDNVTCRLGAKDVSFKDVDLSTLCDDQSTVIKAAITSIVLLIVGIMISVVVAQNYKKIQIYLMHKSIIARFYEDAEEMGKIYDCFISYSHKNREFVEEELIPKLETEFNQRTCVHSRDWDVGEYIMTQIQRSVESSRKTVIVLSEDFLKSMWATVEFNLAHSEALRECRARVILLLLGDVTEHPQLSDELKSYIKTNTYLSCNDPKFWEKLERALPIRKKRFVWRRKKEKQSVNMCGLNDLS